MVIARGDISIKIEDKKIRQALKDIAERLGDTEPAMAVIGEIVKRSVDENFERGGRPDKWKPLAPDTILARQKINKWPGQILVVTSRLQKSVVYKAETDKVRIGTLDQFVDYAAKHHFGHPESNTPARPFLMVQDEDWSKIKKKLGQYIIRGRE